MISPPIIVRDSDGCLGVFDSVQHAEGSLDPDDLEQGEYVAFDSRGTILTFQTDAVTVEKGGYRSGWLDVRYPPQFRLVQVEDEPGHKDELRLTLSRALKLSGLPEVATERMLLADLVQAALNRRKAPGCPNLRVPQPESS